MTAGALIQLQNGTADRMAFLTFNPNISHFKSVYKKYTDFAMETIQIYPIRNATVSFDNDTIITFKIAREGDLVQDMFLTFEFPDIYSNVSASFQWTPRLAEYLVKDITLNIDNQISLDKHYSEWFQIYSEMTLPAEKKDGYYKMIGFTPDYYDPANAPGNGGVYPSTTVGVSLFPSIVGRRICLPLCFWFNKHSSGAFPLIATQKMEFYINVTLRKLNELYTILDNSSPQNRVAPATSTQYIGNFLSPTTSQSYLDLNPVMEAKFIFLAREERKRFALASHEYLITQLQKFEYETNNNIVNIGRGDKEFNVTKPVTDIYFAVRRTDLEDVNQWHNFTNWSNSIDPIPPYTNGYDNPYGADPTFSTSNVASYKLPYLVNAATLLIEGQEITSGRVYNFATNQNDLRGKDNVYYNLIQPYMMQSNIPGTGIYSYSFSLDNNMFQPSGAINMSTIQKKEITLNLTEFANVGYTGSSYNYRIYIFAVNYELVRILGGMIGTATTN